MTSRIVVPHRLCVLLATVCAAIGVLALSCGTAQARLVRPNTGKSFGPAGVGAGTFGQVKSIAVDQSSGDVYVYDKTKEAIYKFTATGEPANFSSTGTNEIEGVTGFGGGAEQQIAADSSSGPDKGDIYLANNEVVDIYSSAGVKLGELTGGVGSEGNEACGVAVDPSGAVYVGFFPNTVNKYVPAANPVKNTDYTESLSGLSAICNIAADSRGDVYAAKFFGNEVKLYAAAQFGQPVAEGTLIDDQGKTLAINPASNAAVIDEGSRLVEYDVVGNATVAGEGELEASFGVAVGATNGDVYAGDASGRVEVFGAPVVEPDAIGAAPTNVLSTSATINGSVNPDGVAATYQFQYGASLNYGSVTPAMPGAAGSDHAIHDFAETLEGLTPDSRYHYRIVATNANGTSYGPDETFETAGPPAPNVQLPDGRVYERVSSAADADSDVYQDLPHFLEPYEGSSTEFPFLVAPNGNAVTYVGGPAEHGGIGAEGTNFGNQYLATRNAAGHWNSGNVDPPSSNIEDLPAFNGFSPDLSIGFVSSAANPPLAPGALGEGYADLYAKTFGTGVYQPLIQTKPEHRLPGQFGTPGMPGFSLGNESMRIAYAGSSANMGHDLFMVNDALTPSAVDGGVNVNNLYDTSGGATVLVNVLPDGSTEPNATFGGPRLAADFVYNAQYDNYPMLAHDISKDGSRVFWTDLNNHNLYVRENDAAPNSPLEGGKCTVPTDACTVLIAEKAQYWNATPDGSKLLYTKGGDLYEYDMETGQATDLAQGGGVHGVVAVSTDLSYVYFVAEEALAPGAESHECEEEEFSKTLCNLYVAHIGEPTKFIGTLSGADNFGKPESESRHTGDWQGSLADTEAEATPDGAHLLFTSTSNFGGYESENHREVFMYDYAGGEIHCLSCLPNGTRSHYPGELSAFLPVSDVGTALPHWMSDDGSRAFFDTLDALVPQDTNEQTDVYEWERDGSGNCKDSSGCIYLLSDGISAEGSYLIGASTSGDDVFITTRGKMAPGDENENTDVYDVRANFVPPPASPQCTGSGCQGVPATPPIFATPPSVTYNGIGNFEEASVLAKASVKLKSLTRADKLAKALKECRHKPKEKRRLCEARARAKYGAMKKGRGSSLGRLGNIRKSSKGGK